MPLEDMEEMEEQPIEERDYEKEEIEPEPAHRAPVAKRLSSIMGAKKAMEEEPPLTPKPPVIPAINGMFTHFRKEVAQKTKEALNVMNTYGASKEEFFSKNSEKVSALFRFISDEAPFVTCQITLVKEQIMQLTISAKKMSGLDCPVPEAIQALVASAAIGKAIPEMREISSTSVMFETQFKIGDDGKLKMYYKVHQLTNEMKLDSYITILDPDLVL